MDRKVERVKGFGKNMKCRGFQYIEGKTYKHEGKVDLCHAGFHFTENPLDTFRFYTPANSIYHNVICSGEIVKSENPEESKAVCSEITIGAEVSLHNLIEASVKYMFSRKFKNRGKHTTGYRSASSATGDRSASSTTGDRSASSVTGNCSASSVTGDRSASSATGDRSASSVTGDSSASSATGKASIAASTGLESKAMAGKYGAIALQWWNQNENRCEMKCAETGCGDGSDGKLKAETWYMLNKNGEFVEID